MSVQTRWAGSSKTDFTKKETQAWSYPAQKAQICAYSDVDKLNRFVSHQYVRPSTKPLAMLPKKISLTLIATSLLAAEPDKLIKLRGSYESAITKATAPIQKTYITELEKLKIEFTKAGKLEDALSVDGEIKKLAPPSSPSVERASAPQGNISQTQKKALEDYLMSKKWGYGEPGRKVYEEATFQKGDKLHLTGNKAPWRWEINKKGLLEIGIGTGTAASVEITTTTTQILLPKFSPNGEDRALTVQP